MKYSSNAQFQNTLLILLIVAGSFVRIFVCLQHNPVDYLFSDPMRHWSNGIHFPRGGYVGAADPILYQIYIAVLRRLTHDNRLLVASASALLSVAMPWTYYRAARNLGMRKISALQVWTLIVWTPSLFTIYHYIMMETLLLALEGFALWMTARYLRKGGSEAFLTSTFAWTLACLTKPTVVPLAGICVLWSWWKKSTPLRDLAIAAVIATVLLIPQAIRSKIELGFVAPFGNPWLTRIQQRSGAKFIDIHLLSAFRDEGHLAFSSPTCYIRPLWPLSSWAIRRGFGNSTIKITINTAHGVRDWKDAYDALNIGWDEWLAQWRENILVSLFAPSWPESTSLQWDSRLEFYARWIWAPLIVLILGCNVLAFSKRRFELIPVAVTLFALILIFQNVITAEGRYRKPLEPLLLLNLVWAYQERGKTSHSIGNVL